MKNFRDKNNQIEILEKSHPALKKDLKPLRWHISKCTFEVEQKKTTSFSKSNNEKKQQQQQKKKTLVKKS